MFQNCARSTTKLTKELLKTVNGTVRRRRDELKTAHKMHRHWELNKNATTTKGPTTTTTTFNKQYTLLSYNILAQDLLTEHLYLYLNVDPQLLRWEQRIQRLRAEVLHLNPDIVCLQEMQYDHLKSFVQQIRGQRRLEYVFKKRTGARTDGCAIIYDRDKFRLLEDRPVEYHMPGDPTLNRENIALLAKFRLREEPSKSVIVATTHLLYNPRRDDVRCAQIERLLEAVMAFSRCANDAAGTEKLQALPVILTGDFNSQSHSPPYALLTAPHPLEPPPKSVAKCRLKGESLQLASLDFGRNSASTYQREWVTVDFVLHSIGGRDRAAVKVWSIYKLPPVAECVRFGNIPNGHLGSDHFSQAISFSVL